MLHEHEKFGDTYAQWGGPMYTIITRDIENIRTMLSRKFRSFEVGDGRHGCVRPLLGDGIFTEDGTKWEISRKLLAPMIQRPTLPELGLIERHFQLLHKAIISDGDPDHTAAEATVDIKQHLLDLSLRLTTEFLLGADVDSTSTKRWTEDFATEFNTAFRWISKRERLKAFHWLVDSLEFRKSCSAAQRLADDAISQAIEARLQDNTATETYVAFEPMLREGHDPKLIRDQFMNILLAGRDTSGALLAWVFYILAREPGLVDTLRDEIESTLGTEKTRLPSKTELNGMTKLDQFICETLRMFPPVPINGRFCTEATSLPQGGGEDGKSPILIPKGTLIAFSTFAAHRNQDLYGPDASKFRIERWNDARTKERRMVDWSYHPFLGGPRKCIGERFAVTQAKYLACRVLQHYEQIIPTDENGKEIAVGTDGSWVDDVKYHVGLTMMPQAGVWIRLVPAT
ncbi:Putative cytochrome P450 [Septoria linicola]|uniref:Cytochrome P450 n=1 Tax=Septoria linicola TaxID=215465 RepID=A0A9Q9ERA4_9PEZI|nr:putative cytochrome P450 [Septoria linicola]USW58368.1 Putative cytochrome P450 [Septoria linicola]